MRGLSGHLHGPTLLCFWSPVMTSSVLPPSTVPWGKGPAPAGSPPPHLLLRLCLERAEASPSPESQNRTFQDSTGPVFHCGNCGQQQRDPCQPRGCPWPLGTVSGLEADMPDEVNIDELLELEDEEERSRKIQGLLKSCTNPTEDFIQELLAKLRGLHKQPGLRQPSPSDDGSLSPLQDRARMAPP
ncbi:protein phosphatase 1 regulatory subunit 14A isoform X1 [Castor canadensis]|uniref:Protein phosphatase 1 regulatory subunit 14A isoform X1 n=1 Tax=Castor canadensis TaxID=51338 RepID=A0AC58L7H9_CASCN